MEDKKTEAFFYDGQFYPDVETMLEDLGWSEGHVNMLPDDYIMEIKEASLEPIVELSVDWILDRIDEERWSEDGDEWNKVHKILEAIPYATINALIPKMYYESNKNGVLNKEALLHAIN